MPTAPCVIDLVLLEDLSGSFANDLPVLKAQIPGLIATVEGLAPDTDFGVASFIDKPTGSFGGAGDYLYQTHLAVSADNDAVRAAIDAMGTRSGLDAPEAQLEALVMTATRPAELGWRTGAKRVVMLSTDAPYHVAGDFAAAGPNNYDGIADGTPAGTGEDYPSIDGLRDALVAAGIFPVFSVTADVRGIYDALVASLGFGHVVTLTSDSANFSDAVRTALAASCGRITEAGTDGNDVLTGTEAEDGIFGGLGDDDIDGRGGDDVVDGGAGADDCRGGEGADDVIGGSGDDSLHGDGGDDVLRGGTGTDHLWGGTGADDFAIAPGDGDDVIEDFEDGLDRIDLSGFGRDAAAAALAAAVEVAGGVRLSLTGASVTVLGIGLADLTEADLKLGGGDARPVARDDAATTSGATPVVIDVLANDFDLEGAALRVVSAGDPAHGAVSLNADGTLRYVADPGFAGVDAFSYVVSDGALAATARVSVTVTPVLIGGPGADSLVGTDAGELMEGFAGEDVILAKGGDDTVNGGDDADSIDGGLGWDVIDGGRGDDVIVAGPTTAAAGSDKDTVNGGEGNDLIFGGGDEDDLFGDDGADEIHGGDADDRIEGGAGNDLLFGDAGDDDILGGEGDDVLDGGSGLDALDGGDGDDLYVISGPGEVEIQDEAADDAIGFDTILFANGLMIDDLTLEQDGNDLVITAAGLLVTVFGHYAAPHKAMEYLGFIDGTAWDIANGLLLPAIAVADALSAVEDVPLTVDLRANDAASGGTVIGVTAAAHGDVALNADGTVTYTPDAEWSGSDHFSYRLKAPSGQLGSAEVSVVVAAANDAPVAGDDAFAIGAGAVLLGDVIAGSDADVDGDALQVIAASGPDGPIAIGVETALSTGGRALLGADGALRFDPAGDFDGLAKGTSATIEIVYTISDGHGGTDAATARITVAAPPNRAPVAVADHAAAVAGQAALIDVLDGDSDPDGDPLTLVSVTGAAHGLAEVFNGAVRYTPDAGFAGVETLTYGVSDGDGGLAEAALTVSVSLPDLRVATPFAEFGTVSVNQKAASIAFSHSYTAPVVFARATSAHGDQAIVARVQDVTATGFSLRVQEPEYLDGFHAWEDVSWAVFEAGAWELDGGAVLQVGTVLTGDAFAPVTFGRGADGAGLFDAAPVALAQTQTAADPDWATTRIAALSAAGMALRVQEEEARGPHAPETIGWLAIEAGVGSVDGHGIAAGAVTVDGSGGAVDFGGAFAAAPAFLAGLGSYAGTDPAVARVSGLSAAGAALQVQEERSADSETGHAPETVDWIALGGAPGTLSANAAEVAMAEYGTVSVNQNAAHIAFSHEFLDPVVFAGPPGRAGGDPVIARVENVTASGFELSVQEDSGADGKHAYETVSWIVMERGEWMLQDGTRLSVGTAALSGEAQDGFDHFDFVESFDAAPVIGMQLQTAHDPGFALLRASGLDAAGFDMAIQNEEAAFGAGHVEETAGWFAIAQGAGEWSGAHRVADLVADVGSYGTAAGFDGGFSTAPALFGALTSWAGRDPALLRAMTLDADGATLYAQEDRSADAETAHAYETASILALEGEGVLTASAWHGLL